MIAGFSVTVLGCAYLSVLAGEIVFVPPDNGWVVFFTFVPMIASGITMFVAAMLTQKSHPPVPLKDTDGNIQKWPELEARAE